MQHRILGLQKSSSGPLAVVLAGDIFDRDRIEGPTLRAFATFVDELYTRGIPVYFIQGNHDLDREDPLPGVEGALSLNGKLENICGVRVYGLDWMPREQLKEALLTVPECDVLVLHAKMKHLCGFGIAADLSLDDIPERVRHVVVGDIHVPDQTELRGKGFCISPGGLHPCTLAETREKCYAVLDTKDPWSWTLLALDSRPIEHVLVLTEQDVQMAMSKIVHVVSTSRPGFEPLIEIRYATAFSNLLDGFYKMTEGKAFLFPKPSTTGKILESADLEEARKSFREITLHGALSTVVDRTKEPEVFGFVDELLQVPDGTAVVDRIMEDICSRVHCT